MGKGIINDPVDQNEAANLVSEKHLSPEDSDDSFEILNADIFNAI